MDIHAVHSTNYENKYATTPYHTIQYNAVSTFRFVDVLVCRRFGLSTFWSVDVLVCRRFGLSTYWFVDVLVCRRFGLSMFRFVDVLVCRRFGLSTFWSVDVLFCRRFGLSTFRFVDVLVCRRFGCRRFGLSTFWPVTVVSWPVIGCPNAGRRTTDDPSASDDHPMTDHRTAQSSGRRPTALTNQISFPARDWLPQKFLV